MVKNVENEQKIVVPMNIQKDNNNQSGLDINDIEEFPPL